MIYRAEVWQCIMTSFLTQIPSPIKYSTNARAHARTHINKMAKPLKGKPFANHLSKNLPHF